MAAIIVAGLTVYGAAGALVALGFLLIGLDRLDPAAHGAYGFRPLLVPGLVLLWPLIVVLWVRREIGEG
jgi:hypothetical protein